MVLSESWGTKYTNTSTQTHKYTNTVWSNLQIDPTSAIFFHRKLYQDIKNNIPKCLTCKHTIKIGKYTNTILVKFADTRNMCYIFWKGNGTRTPKIMFLSVYNHLWEISFMKQAKRTQFGRAEWKSAKNTIYKNTIWASAHERARVIFLEVKKDPLGSPQKNLAHLARARSAIKSTFCPFLAFL